MVDKVYLEWTPAAINSSYNLWGHLYLVKREKHTSLDQREDFEWRKKGDII